MYTFYKKIYQLQLSSFLIPIGINSRKDIVTKLEQNQSPINRSLNFTSGMTLTVLDLNVDSENCFLIVFTITLFNIIYLMLFNIIVLTFENQFCRY